MNLYKNMFVVIDPTQKKQPALERAAKIAEKNKARITAFSAVYTPIEEMIAKSRKSGKKETLKACDKKTKEMTARYRDKGIKIKNAQFWTEDWYAAISRAALRWDADLVIKSTFRHGKLQRLLHGTSDFVIMRHSPAPVLLVRERKSFSGKAVVAALDLESVGEGHIGLNNLIMKHARRHAELSGLPLHILAATSAKPDLSHLLIGAEEQEDGLEATVANSFDVEVSNLHIVRGDPRKVIPQYATSLKADTVVIGVSAHSGVKGILVGSTAQKVLDNLDCDVLAVH